jgi:glycosyltransferase involved in cell wall biosynthesis
MDFTILINVRNEESRLPSVIAEIRKHFNGEIVIADCDSTDNTVTIATNLQCNVVQLGNEFTVPFTDSDIKTTNEYLGEQVITEEGMAFEFAPARNKAAVYAKHNYVLNIDAGDTIEHMDYTAIKQLLTPGCVFAYTHYLMDVGTHNQIAVRFFDKRTWHYRGRVHEFVEKKKGSVTCPRVTLPENVLCIRNRKSLHPERSHNYLYGLCKDAQEHTSTRWCHYLGRELYYKKHWHAAIHVLEQGIALPGGWNSEKCQGLCFVGECWLHLNDAQKAILAFNRAIGQDATRREPWLQLARIHQTSGNIAATRGFTHAATIFPKTVGLYENAYNYSTIPQQLLTWCNAHSTI